MFSSLWSSRLAFLAVCLLGFINYVSAYETAYCSDLNTADTPKNTSMYQSNGLCTGFCVQSHAFAVVQYDGCWCSDYIPSTTTDTSSCSQKCPGYGFESCGGDGLFGYIALNRAPSGTQGADPPPSSTSAPQSSKTSTTEESKTTETTATSTWVPTPITRVETITGQVRTVTITPTVPPNSQNLNDLAVKKGGGSGGLGTGGAVGLTIGLVALVAIICALIYCFLKKRKEQKEEEYNNMGGGRPDSSSAFGGPVPSRTMSENSRYVLGTDGHRVVETWEADNRDAPGSRTSRLMPVDPRLDPFAPVYKRGENKSRESVNTIRDDHDYSRRVHQQGPILRATNPDA